VKRSCSACFAGDARSPAECQSPVVDAELLSEAQRSETWFSVKLPLSKTCDRRYEPRQGHGFCRQVSRKTIDPRRDAKMRRRGDLAAELVVQAMRAA